MCGRFSLSVPHGQIQHMVDYPDLDVAEADWIDQDDFFPRYNIAPRSNAPVIRRQDPDQSELVIHTMKWGVVPHWSKHEDLTLNTINARAENLVESGGMWSSMKSKKRCVVVCDGYFEWLKKGKERLPHFIRRRDNKLMVLAGLYDSVVLEGATNRMWTFTIVTTDASTSLAWLHDRQPVILSSTSDFEKWLDTSQGWHKGLVEIMKPGDGKELECYPVPKEVGRVGANSSDFIKPVSQRKGGIEALFAKQAAKGKHASSRSPNKQDFPSSPSKPSTSKDAGAAGQVIDVDASPQSSPSSDNGQQRTQKRTMAGDPEGISPKKRMKNTGLE
ncbi:hypothetical protein JB92DRAFT_1744278 [Gautieria morchelliformis]|nr:hypothetical protein JB92DRAFT_1744278 [Gautieria morchelliformis]